MSRRLYHIAEQQWTALHAARTVEETMDAGGLLLDHLDTLEQSPESHVVNRGRDVDEPCAERASRTTTEWIAEPLSSVMVK